ncbi:MAG: flagellar basal body rod protein FlgB [Calditrichaeota bacterium]|nr:flagellar basal body rod protein FlgB [Calditrichota bacterium]MCB9367869.1 flagellar basal body rod protein FlgB [Calditrichota bacterium]
MADNNLIQNYLTAQNPATSTLRSMLDAQAARQRAHSQNIANAETPGYQRVRVEFEDLLQEKLDGQSQKLAQADQRHIPSTDDPTAQIKVTREAIPEDATGVNGVNIEEEMAEMAETQLRYLTALELLKRRYSDIKSAITGTVR